VHLPTLQQVHEHSKEAYGLNYAETRPDIAILREEINHMLAARTKRITQRRYEKGPAQRERFVAETPKANEVQKLPMTHLFQRLAFFSDNQSSHQP